MAEQEIDPKYKGWRVKLEGIGLVEVCEENREILISAGLVKYFKKKRKSNVSNNEKSIKPTVRKRKRKSNVRKS